MKRLALLVMLAGCGMDMAGQDNPDAGGSTDAGVCTLTISFDPPQPIASTLAPIRAQASLVGAPGVYTYSWSVSKVGGSSARPSSTATAAPCLTSWARPTEQVRQEAEPTSFMVNQCHVADATAILSWMFDKRRCHSLLWGSLAASASAMARDLP
jgi:hypothetical protein